MITHSRRIPTEVGVVALLAASGISVLLLTVARSTSNQLLQIIEVLMSMGLLFYAAHPLGHHLAGIVAGAATDHFYLGTSDFKNLNLAPAKVIGRMLPTIGTKFDRQQLARLSNTRRGYIFGAGVIVSNLSIGLELGYVVIAGFGLLSIVIALAFFLISLGTEVMFSTKAGDLYKMKRQFLLGNPS